MSRAHVVDLVTQLIWAALSGMLREAGITVDPDQPLPGMQPSLMRLIGDRPAEERSARVSQRPGESDGRTRPRPDDDHDDGYEGPATLVAGGARVDVQVRLRGHFQPIDGRYHWYGRIEPNEAWPACSARGRARAVLTTPEGSAPCELSDPDPWQRYRVTGLSTPPFAAQTATRGAPQDEAANPEPRGEISTAAPETTERRPAARRARPAPLPGHVRVAIIGAGFGGIGAAIALRKAGHTDFVVLERATAVGGTWRDNSYPGCTCDVPSHLYSFSFAPNPDWTRSFSRQPEIWDYLERVTDQLRTARQHPF